MGTASSMFPPEQTFSNLSVRVPYKLKQIQLLKRKKGRKKGKREGREGKKEGRKRRREGGREEGKERKKGSLKLLVSLNSLLRLYNYFLCFSLSRVGSNKDLVASGYFLK